MSVHVQTILYPTICLSHLYTYPLFLKSAYLHSLYLRSTALKVMHIILTVFQIPDSPPQFDPVDATIAYIVQNRNGHWTSSPMIRWPVLQVIPNPSAASHSKACDRYQPSYSALVRSRARVLSSEDLSLFVQFINRWILLELGKSYLHFITISSEHRSLAPKPQVVNWAESPFPFFKNRRSNQERSSPSPSLQTLSCKLALEYFAWSRAASFATPACLDFVLPLSDKDIRSCNLTRAFIFQDGYLTTAKTRISNTV